MLNSRKLVFWSLDFLKGSKTKQHLAVDYIMNLATIKKA